MKIDGINLINDSSVTDARIENGNTLPALNAEDEGRMFWLNRSYQDYVPGLYVCDGVVWNYTNDNNSAAVFTPITINTHFTAPSNRLILADTSLGGFQLTLPENPVVGDYIYIIDVKGTFNTDYLTLVRNGAPIRGVNENLQIKVQFGTVFMYFTGDPSIGWSYSTLTK